MSNANDSKLSAHFVWLFAIASIVVGIGVSYALSGFGQKVTAGAYFAIIGIGGFLSTFLTRARIRGGLGAFFMASAGASAAYYLLISKLFGAASDAVAGSSTSQADLVAAQGVQAAGNTFGLIIAVVVFLTTFIAATIGVVAGAKSRGAGAGAIARNLVKSAG